MTARVHENSVDFRFEKRCDDETEDSIIVIYIYIYIFVKLSNQIFVFLVQIEQDTRWAARYFPPQTILQIHIFEAQK